MDENDFAARIECNRIVANVIRGYQRQLAEAQAERDTLKDAAKTLQRVQFILGGHSGIIADTDEDALRENVERALSLMREKLPLIVAALEESHS